MTDMQQKSILLIDDEQLSREAMIRKFTEEKFTVFEASDGAAGLALALQTHPDLIILDIILPQMGGFKVMENLRKDSWGEKVPIIILTNLTLDYTNTPSVMKDYPLCYFEKVNTPLDKVIAKAKEVLLANN